jgi:phenylpropionate dioxygenase-like ring-hydroxylating dioxygenase large terminal subunit
MDAVVGRSWPAGLTRIPYWIYQDPDVLALEQKRIFEGPVWNYLCLETELPNVGDYRTTFVGAMPVVVVPRTMATSPRSRTAARIVGL